MKQLVFMACLALLSGVTRAEAQQKEFTEVIKKEVSFSNSTANILVIKNVFGSISVEGYSGSKVIVEVDKTITADTSSDLELGKQELQLKIVEEADRIILHPDAPYIEFDKNKLKYNWCHNNNEPDYEHQLNFKVRVPSAVQVHVSTVNDGEVLVKNTKGNHIVAENINGGITLDNVTGTTMVECINGEVSISYADNPSSSSRYFSLNGDINISYQKALSANISFKSMNGEMYTDFNVNKQFMKTSKQLGKGNQPKYKFEAKPVVQIGSGQVDHEFETLNGNVYIKKI